jgi:predicted dehydrogenase
MSADPSSSAYDGRSIRWGVIGAGGIATKFCDDLQLLPDHEVVAVGARSAGTSDAFASRFGIARVHSSYADLAAEPLVDAVYVATPHPMHHDAAMLAIEAGKAVLVEKPFTMDAAEARALVEAARGRGTLLMEAMWTRFLPHMVAVRDVLASGRLGDLVLVTAEHGQWFAEDADSRLFAPGLGGGALLDLGIYPVSFASMVLGTPSHITAVSNPAFTGVDAQTSVILRDDAGRHAVLTTTLAAATSNGATISGTVARLEIAPTFYRPTSFRIVDRDGAEERVEVPHVGNGLRHQAAEVGRCLRKGLTESPVLTLDETVSIMETMDEIRRQIGFDHSTL